MIWIFFMIIGGAMSASPYDLHNLEHTEESLIKENDLLKQIGPGSSSQSYIKFSDLFPKDDKLYKTFNKYIEAGVTIKGLTFNIYNDEMRDAAIALYRLLRETLQSDKTNFVKLRNWAKYNVNKDILDYVLRLASLFSAQKMDENFLPPFVDKPSYFVSGDSIIKAIYYRVNNGKIEEDVKKIYQITNEDENSVIIDSMVRCNVSPTLCATQIKYFAEDVALNSYYYGLHLLHPFWMTDEELNEVNPDHAAHYYFVHQQLYARYLLEKEHLDLEAKILETKITPNFEPYLYYENGLSFPTRTTILGNAIRKDVRYLQTIDIAITECLQRGIVQMDNGTLIRLTDDNYMNFLAKFLRFQIESTKAAKIIRSVFGYATDGYPVDMYNPAPSVMHHPQTAIRDPVYWYLIKRVVDYFLFYTNNTEHYNFSKYETNEFTINNIEISNITTTYEYYLINLYKVLEGDSSTYTSRPDFNIFARQERLSHKPFEVNFTVDCKTTKDVIILIFIGPQCHITYCWEIHSRFFQLDRYHRRLGMGPNLVTWSPSISSRYSSDHMFNSSAARDNVEENYDIFKFPKNLVIPKGRKDGLNLTMFIMVVDEGENISNSKDSTRYMQVTNEISEKPLGFPFHKRADLKTLNDKAPNYRFYNVTIFHDKDFPDSIDHFRPY